MKEQLVQTAVKSVLLYQRIVLAQQITHRALLKPLPVQTPLAPRLNEPITHQGLQDMARTGAFPAIGQPRRPEPIEPKLLVEFACQPARPPLPSSMQPKLLKPHLNPVFGGMIGNLPIPSKVAKDLCWPRSSSNPSMTLHHPSRWLSLTSPRYNTGRCTILPPAQRRFSTIDQ